MEVLHLSTLSNYLVYIWGPARKAYQANQQARQGNQHHKETGGSELQSQASQFDIVRTNWRNSQSGLISTDESAVKHQTAVNKWATNARG